MVLCPCANGIGENVVSENQTINEFILILNFNEANEELAVTHINTSKEIDNISALAIKRQSGPKYFFDQMPNEHCTAARSAKKKERKMENKT